MALSELQKILVGGLKVCGVSKGDTVIAMLMLKTEDQQWALADYLEDVVDNPPSSQEIMRIIQSIAQS